MSGLPPYETHNSTSVTGDQVQAIVPSYRFACGGKIKGWGACFFPAGPDSRYHMVYQVWREVTPGCFALVGPLSSEDPQTTNLLRVDSGCNTTRLGAGKEIYVEAGDVVGFYVDYWFQFSEFVLVNVNQLEAGVQLVRNYTGVEVLYTRIPEDELSSSYATGPTPESVCSGALDGFSGSRLLLTATGAPVVTVVFG